MPRYAIMYESGNINATWSTRTINAQNSHTSSANSTILQDQALINPKVGLVYKILLKADNKVSSTQFTLLYMYLFIGGDQYRSIASSTAWVTRYISSGNIKATKRYTQTDVDDMYFRESADNSAKYAKTYYTTNRLHQIYYCYEHQCGGLAPMKMNKIGGLDIGKVWKIGGRSQISGDGDVVYA